MATYQGAVRGGTLAFRSEPNSTSSKVNGITLPDKADLDLNLHNDEWFSTTYQGYSGYVMARWIWVKSGTGTSNGTIVVSGSVNVRPTPSTAQSPSFTLTNGTSVLILRSVSGYKHVSCSAGTGYVQDGFVTTGGSGSTTLKNGDSGDAVRDLQNKLNASLYYLGTLDGVFGNNTTWAVKWFQQQNGLSVDSIAGPNTFAKLNGTHIKGVTSNPMVYSKNNALWSAISYGTSTLGAKGMGPTCLAMVVSGLKNKSYLPYHVYSNTYAAATTHGTTDSYFTNRPADFGLSCVKTLTASTATTNVNAITTQLATGAKAIVKFYGDSAPYSSYLYGVIKSYTNNKFVYILPSVLP